TLYTRAPDLAFQLKTTPRPVRWSRGACGAEMVRVNWCQAEYGPGTTTPLAAAPKSARTFHRKLPVPVIRVKLIAVERSRGKSRGETPGFVQRRSYIAGAVTRGA